jgi:hypothetical protein
MGRVFAHDEEERAETGVASSTVIGTELARSGRSRGIRLIRDAPDAALLRVGHVQRSVGSFGDAHRAISRWTASGR